MNTPLKRNPFNLSPREIEVLVLRCDGLSYIEIAEKLFIDKRTVETHIRSLYNKMDISAIQILLLKKAIIGGYYTCPELDLYYQNVRTDEFDFV